MAVAVRAEGLTRRFGAFVAVDHVSFAIAPGEVWGFLGPNGAGKSTTIRMLCGVLAPSAGRAEVLGYDVRRYPEAVKARIGYMSQRFALWSDLTVRENLAFYAGVYGLRGREVRERIAAWLERLGLLDRQDALAGTLSGGYRQRLALAAAVLHRPPVVFLDEPTAGMDPRSRRQFWELIRGFAEDGTTVMVTTHYMDEAEHCDRLAFIDQGRIIAQGSPAEIKARQMVGHVLEVRVEPLIEALAVVEEHPAVREAALYGAAIHATVDQPEAGPALAAALAARGFAVEGVEPVLPSLEDVFVALVEAREREAAA